MSSPPEMGKGGIALSIFLSLFFLFSCGPIFFVLLFLVFLLPLALIPGVPDWIALLPAALAGGATLLISFLFGPSAVLRAKEKMLIRRAEVKRAREDLTDELEPRPRSGPNPDGERLREELRREREARKRDAS